jgi:hypothetical protein
MNDQPLFLRSFFGRRADRPGMHRPVIVVPRLEPDPPHPLESPSDAAEIPFEGYPRHPRVRRYIVYIREILVELRLDPFPRIRTGGPPLVEAPFAAESGLDNLLEAVVPAGIEDNERMPMLVMDILFFYEITSLTSKTIS